MSTVDLIAVLLGGLPGVRLREVDKDVRSDLSALGRDVVAAVANVFAGLHLTCRTCGADLGAEAPGTHYVIADAQDVLHGLDEGEPS